MTSNNPVILLEFNELCPSLMERFIDEGHLPHFKRLRDESAVYTTDANEEQENLEPWIQWVTVHTGLGFDEHRIFNLNDGNKLNHDSVWDIMQRAGKTVWLCGSMNIKYQAAPNVLVLPDPWSSNTKPNPESLQAFYRFVQVQVQEHTNRSIPLSRQDYVNFIYFLMRHGLSATSAVEIVKQLLSERIGKRGRWMRAVILDKLQWDVFRWYYKEYRPDFSTFFLNSTAHFQHKFWRTMEPEKFKARPSQSEIEEYGNAILFGYKEMDRIVGSALMLAGDSATLLLSSALSQQPYLKMEDSGGKRFYRPCDFHKFVDFVGLQGVKQVAPVMSEQFHIYFETESEAEDAEERLRRVTLDGRPAMAVRRDGSDLFSGCTEFSTIPMTTMLKVDGTDRTIGFFDMFYQADSVKSGMHHSEGIFWVRGRERKNRVETARVPLKSVAPTILHLMQLPVPPQMRAEPLPV